MSDELIKRSEVLRMMKNSSIDGPRSNLVFESIWRQAHDCCIDLVEAVKTEDVVSFEDHERMKREIVTEILRTQRLTRKPGVFIPNLEMPLSCLECWFRSPSEELNVDVGLYKKISRCLLAPEDIEDPWRDVTWQMNHREEFCPLVEMKEGKNNDT